MRIFINDLDNTREDYFKIFGNFGYEDNELIFCNSFKSSRDFIETHLEKKQLHIDLIISNNSDGSGTDVLKANQFCF